MKNVEKFWNIAAEILPKHKKNRKYLDSFRSIKRVFNRRIFLVMKKMKQITSGIEKQMEKDM